MLRTATRSPIRNTLAAAVTVVTAGLLYSSFDPVPAGDDLEGISTVAPPAPVAVKTEIDSSTPEASQDASGSRVNQHLVNVKECLDRMTAGAEFFRSIPDYTVTFHKLERIGGDLQAPQTIHTKIQQKPHFAVYMKWQNFERGRQLLYSDSYEDGCIVVKLGGMKRFLPAVRLDPNGSMAMAETRYPATEAGIVGMIDQISSHRKNDLKIQPKMTCTRTEVEFNGRPGIQFYFEYDSPKGNATYRKSFITLDKEHGVPVDVRNYTWSSESKGLTEAQLDEQTLIEQYSFTDLNITTELADVDFSRENPRYRM